MTAMSGHVPGRLMLGVAAVLASAFIAAAPSAQERPGADPQTPVPAAPARGAPGGGRRLPAPPATGRPGALIDLTGYWVSVVNEDWRWRMMTPPKGDYASVPLNLEGLRVANTWEPGKDEANGTQCRAYGAAGIIRMPGHLHITWEDDTTLRLEFDAGTQTRRLHFGDAQPPAGEPDWQGHSVASWQKQRQIRSFSPSGPPRPGGSLKIITTRMRPGYLRKNGVPYSDTAVMTEYVDTFTLPHGGTWLAVTTVVEDPRYLNMPFVISSQFKQESDGSHWHPTPCTIDPSTR